MDDAEIVRALISGEDGAWEFFVERYAGVALATARRVLAVRGGRPAQADLDDVCENTFLMLLRDDARLLRRYDPAHSLGSYVAVVARTAAHRWLRRRRPTADLPEGMWGDAIADERALSLSDRTTHGEVRAAVREALEELSARDRRLLRLFYYEGKDYRELAHTLGISVNSVGAALSRARARLAKALAAHPELTESDWRSL